MELINNNLFVNLIKLNITKAINSIEFIEKKKEIKLKINNKYLQKVLFILKYTSILKFNTLLDLFGIDYINNLQINYYLLNLEKEIRILLKVPIKNNIIESIINIYNSANWLEREVWDLFGIIFKNHSDLRRILTDYGFEGYPLLKLFPLSGYFELFYTNELKKVSLKEIELTQEYRIFEFQNPWFAEILKIKN